MVCFDTPTSRATSSTARPASTCFKAAIISASLCLLRDMLIPLSFDEIIINFVRNQGSRSVVQQIDPDHYQSLAKVPTTIGARTGLWYEKRDRFYLAVPASSKQGAALWVYAPED